VFDSTFPQSSLMDSEQPIGLTLWAMNFFALGYDQFGAICFVLSIGFKQMALYYAPIVFAYLLGKCISLGSTRG